MFEEHFEKLGIVILTKQQQPVPEFPKPVSGVPIVVRPYGEPEPEDEAQSDNTDNNNE